MKVGFLGAMLGRCSPFVTGWSWGVEEDGCFVSPFGEEPKDVVESVAATDPLTLGFPDVAILTMPCAANSARRGRNRYAADFEGSTSEYESVLAWQVNRALR